MIHTITLPTPTRPPRTCALIIAELISREECVGALQLRSTIIPSQPITKQAKRASEKPFYRTKRRTQ
jgi:hypothetical protein